MQKRVEHFEAIARALIKAWEQFGLITIREGSARATMLRQAVRELWDAYSTGQVDATDTICEIREGP